MGPDKMIEIAEDVREVRTDVRHLLKLVDVVVQDGKKRDAQVEARLDGIDARFEANEKKDIRRTAWAAGAAAVVTFVLSHASTLVKLAGLLLSACVLAACAASPLPLPPTEPVGQWAFGRPYVITESEGLSDECLQATELAVATWRARGVPVVSQTRPADDGVFAGLTMGAMTVVPDPVTDPAAGAETAFLIRKDLKLLAGAEIRTRHCDPWYLAHELGHAFGLPHQPHPSSLMYPTDAAKQWGVSELELGWVR